MLLLMSSWMLSQRLSTANSNSVQIPTSQVTELYKITKQNDYLKARTTSAEKALNEAEKLVKSQEQMIEKKDVALKLSGDMLDGAKKEHQKDLEIKNYEIERLVIQLDESKRLSKKNGRKKFWKGFTIGGVTVGIIGTATAFYLMAK